MPNENEVYSTPEEDFDDVSEGIGTYDDATYDDEDDCDCEDDSDEE